MSKPSVYGFTQEQLIEWLLPYGHKKFRAQQVWDWLYRKRVTAFEEMTDVNLACLAVLEEYYAISTLEEHTKQVSADGTVKFLFRLSDGNLIETVLMRHKFGLSVCVTTRAGCWRRAAI
jgi:23S rRNA (adenine2503-C2)-methyltransferase